MTKKKINILIICKLDNFANRIRPLQIKTFLEMKGNYSVEILDIYKQNSNISYQNIFFSKLKTKFPKIITNFFFLQRYKKNAEILLKEISKKNIDVLICEDAFSSYIFNEKHNFLTIYDCPAPWTEELYMGGQLTNKYYKIFLNIELNIYKNVDILSFHWENYRQYVKEYLYNGNNLYSINFGVTKKPKNKKAKYSVNPRIIFMGKLDGYWNNLELLSNLSKQYPIDVYGGPKPNEKWGLNYKGYAITTDILSSYQFGLITITKDKLRKSSFSSKQLEYMSYGLPVLTPEWKRDVLLDKCSIKYNEKNFLDILKKYSSKLAWEKMSENSYKHSLKYSWNSELQKLENLIVEKLQKYD